ncbi:MAG: hypothetical protein AUH76_16750 [Candidatus Rokubacteria bacterium 13_1_40CM_4_67_11]|nr:MAG: hypothetical protein AUH76_16750 [Candidatus Rokubacteria bacterium 13_1_40CM_4_67_11]
MAIAERREALWHRRQGKVRGIGGIHFVPLERRRDPRLGGGPHGVRRGDRAVLGVLIVVDEDAMALFLPPLARGELGDAALDVARQRQRRAAHRVEAPAPLDAHQDVEAAAARGLGPAGEPHVPQRGVHHMRHLTHLRPLDAGHGIEVHAQLVGMVQVLGADRMRVQLEAGEVGEPRQRSGVATTSIHGGRASGARFW